MLFVAPSDTFLVDSVLPSFPLCTTTMTRIFDLILRVESWSYYITDYHIWLDFSCLETHACTKANLLSKSQQAEARRLSAHGVRWGLSPRLGGLCYALQLLQGILCCLCRAKEQKYSTDMHITNSEQARANDAETLVSGQRMNSDFWRKKRTDMDRSHCFNLLKTHPSMRSKLRRLVQKASRVTMCYLLRHLRLVWLLPAAIKNTRGIGSSSTADALGTSELENESSLTVLKGILPAGGAPLPSFFAVLNPLAVSDPWSPSWPT